MHNETQILTAMIEKKPLCRKYDKGKKNALLGEEAKKT
jgi:hypothetical protein